ncbi:MAG: hypothetical protein ACI8PZ_000507, partial [Myxococcota bacterium]
MAGLCTLSTDPPTAVALEFLSDASSVPRTVDLPARPAHTVEIPVLTADTVWSWTATPKDRPDEALSGAFSTSDAPADLPLYATVSGEPVAPYVLISAACEDDAWSVVFDANTGEPAWAQRAGAGQPDNVRLTPDDTVLTLTEDRLTEHDLQGALLLDLPMGPDGVGLITHHDAATWGDWVYVLYTDIGDGEGRPLHDGVLVLDRAGEIVGDLFLPDIVDFPLDVAGDYSHANAVSPTGDGDVLVSLRHQQAVLRIAADPDSGEFGQLRWQLIGSLSPVHTDLESDFELRGADGSYEVFRGQHDANLLPDGRLTLFDNGFTPEDGTRGIDIALDPKSHTATVERVYT